MSFTWRIFNSSISRGSRPTNCQICLVELYDKKRNRRLFPQAAVWYDNRWWVRFHNMGGSKQIRVLRVFYPSKVVQNSIIDAKAYRCYYCNTLDTDLYEVLRFAPFDTVSVEEVEKGEPVIFDQIGEENTDDINI